MAIKNADRVEPQGMLLQHRVNQKFFEPVLFALPYDRRVRREGIATIRAPLVDSDLAQVDGLIVTSSERS